MDQLGQHCEQCPLFLSLNLACPSKPDFAHNSYTENVIQVVMVFCSLWFGYTQGFFFFIRVYLLKAFTKRLSVRQFCLSMLTIWHFVANEITKRLVREPRPPEACTRTTFGMPSGHANFVFCLFTWYLLEAYFTRSDVRFKKSLLYRLEKWIVLIFGPLTPLSRVYLHYHTEKQVIVGSVIGIMNALLTFYIAHSLLTNSKSWINAYIKRERAKYGAEAVVNEYENDSVYYALPAGKEGKKK